MIEYVKFQLKYIIYKEYRPIGDREFSYCTCGYVEMYILNLTSLWRRRMQTVTTVVLVQWSVEFLPVSSPVSDVAHNSICDKIEKRPPPEPHKKRSPTCK